MVFYGILFGVMQHVVLISMMCVYIEAFSISVIAPHAGMVFYGILFWCYAACSIYIHDKHID